MGGTFSKPENLADRKYKKSLHAALMIWSWGVFIPSGAALATWGKDMEGGPNWFLSHRSLGWAGVSIATAGMVVGRAIATGGERATSHRLIGYAATLMGLAQPVIAYFRGKMTPDEKRQPLFAGGPSWYALHKYLGWLCIALGLYNIRLGIKMHDPDRALSTVYSSGVVAVGALTAAWNYKSTGLPMDPLGLG